ncbi:MAG: prepilin-type N-terminal cleavage/methylation domain-containing protein [Methylacidiphilales bacterium]|nr:prepilin-type N-terminal cleavage/methylation domain-containing protein [Candidatus Methylacidiphilales bacterium]
MRLQEGGAVIYAQIGMGGLNRNEGFTLVEFLVSTAAFCILMLLLLSFFNQATSAWQNSEKKTDAFREARAAFHYIRSDLQNITVTEQIPLYTGSQAELVAVGGNYAAQSNSDKIFFLCKAPRAGQVVGGNKSDLCATGYYVAYTRCGISGGAYNLHRYFKSSDETWGANSPAPGAGLQPYLTNRSNPLFMPAAATRDGDEILARNVTDFIIRPCRSDFSSPSIWPAFERPAFFDVSLRAFNYSTAKKFQGSEDWTRNTMLRMQNSRLFRMRVSTN